MMTHAKNTLTPRFGYGYPILGGRPCEWAMNGPKSGAFIPGSRPRIFPGGLIPARNESSEVGFSLVGACNEIRIESDGWIQIAPYGEWPNEVGLQVMDRQAAEAMVSDFNSVAAKLSNSFRGLPFYIGHPDDPEVSDQFPDKKSYGWWKELAARNDGLWGKAKLSKAGKELIDENHYMYVSPFWGMRPVPGRNQKAFRPVVLYSVGLTNNPQIPGQPVGRNEKPTTKKDTMDRAKLIKALGLKPTAPNTEVTDDQIYTAVNEAGTALANALQAKTTAETNLTTAVNEKKTMEGQITAANSARAVAEEKFNTERKARIDDILTTAVNEGRIKEADRPKWAGDLTSDFDVKSAELAKLTKAVNTTSRTAGMGARRGEVSVPLDVINAINTKVKKYQKDHGVSHDEAFSAVEREHPELFQDKKGDE